MTYEFFSKQKLNAWPYGYGVKRAGRLQATPTKRPKQVIDQSDCVRTELKSLAICSCFHF